MELKSLDYNSFSICFFEFAIVVVDSLIIYRYYISVEIIVMGSFFNVNSVHCLYEIHVIKRVMDLCFMQYYFRKNEIFLI